MSILIFFIILLVLVIAHEFGHFVIAKLAGMRVDEFGFGFPPRLFARKKGETEYSFNALPFGGFVKIFGEDPNEIAELCLAGKLTPEEAKRSFVSQNKLKQAAVVVAGVVFNFILAWFLLSLGFVIGMPTQVAKGEDSAANVIITSVLPNSPAALAGFKPADKIIKIGNESKLDESVVQNFIASHPNQEINITIERAGEIKNISVVPKEGVIENHAAIGVSLALVGIKKLPIHLAFWEGFKKAAVMTKEVAIAFGKFIRDAFLAQAKISSLTGPVGLVGIVADTYKLGLVNLLSLTALISINLAVINLVPFPALDGGRLLLIFIEKLKGSAISPKLVSKLNLIGFVLLIFLLVFVTYFDVRRLL